MFKQLIGKKALPQSLLCIVLACLVIFFLVGCDSNYTLTGSTTNGNGHQGQGTTSNGGSAPTQTTGSGSANSGSGSTNSGSGSTNSGSGSTNSGSGTFQVISVNVTVSPSDISGTPCGGAPLTVTYTATFTLAPNGPGGDIHFNYSTNDGRGQTAAAVTVSAGQTTATYQFSRTDGVGPAFSFPAHGIVQVTSPNQVLSNQAIPSGQCS